MPTLLSGRGFGGGGGIALRFEVVTEHARRVALPLSTNVNGVDMINVTTKSSLFCLFCLLLGLLVSCDRTEEPGNPAEAGERNPRASRASRPARDQVPSRNESLRRAIQAALEIESPEAREQALAEIVRETFETAPEIASEALGFLAVGGEERRETIGHLAIEFYQKDPAEALLWIDGLPFPEDVALAREEIGLVLAATDPAAAARMVLGSGSGRRQFNENEAAVLYSWTGSAPADAAAWVHKLPPGEARRAGIKAVASRWMQTDSKSAFAWTAAIYEENLRRDSTRAMAEALVEIPDPIREFFLDGADPAFRAELERQVDQLTVEAESDR